MMLVKPEGLWPEAVRRRELHEEELVVTKEASQEKSPASSQ
jgi:hypothetical protein